MNEIILGGTSSTELEGLIIQTLPPITKPKMRTSIEEINGRDGDIVTPLGYSAYDKSFTIGLSYNYDIDEIIDYFNTQGTVVFSNEPDKYYNYQILEQIDFERLIRFKTATVTMHVQPFKYSTQEGQRKFTTSLLTFTNYTKTTNGITLQASDGIVSISGTGTAATEFYFPIEALNLGPDAYTLSAYASGNNANSSAIRLIYNSPSSSNSFGGTYVTLQNNDSVSISSTLSTSKTYNYIYFYINPNVELNFTINFKFSPDDQTYVIRNSGNVFSRPTLTIYGSGTINLYINSIQIFVIQLGNEEYITIDSSGMEAYREGILKNRLITGDYNNCILNEGLNNISFTGGVTKFVVENYSRWI